MDVVVGGAGDLQRWTRDPKAYDDAVKEHVASAVMGEIVGCEEAQLTLSFGVETSSPIVGVEVRNGSQVIETLRPYGLTDLGSRVRVLMTGADRRGKGSRARWKGTARIDGSAIGRFAAIAAWNSELPCSLADDGTIAFEARTAGNLMGFDVFLNTFAGGRLVMETGNGSVDQNLENLGLDPVVHEMGGLARQVRVQRLPDENPHLTFSGAVTVSVKAGRDNPLWICVTTEDGHQAWSSPVYVVDD